jgi:hypothetical protein
VQQFKDLKKNLAVGFLSARSPGSNSPTSVAQCGRILRRLTSTQNSFRPSSQAIQRPPGSAGNVEAVLTQPMPTFTLVIVPNALSTPGIDVFNVQTQAADNTGIAIALFDASQHNILHLGIAPDTGCSSRRALRKLKYPSRSRALRRYLEH